MAESLGKAVLTLATDQTAYDKGMTSAQAKALKLGQTFKKVGKGLTIGVTLPLAAAGVAAGKAASDLAESMNAVNVVFGDSADKIAEWGKTAAQSAGLAQSDFNQAATTIGSMLQNVGMSASEAADQSINLTQRAADMASVFNTDVSDALGAIQAGIRGEIDPLERFGVGLSMAAVQAYAVEKGIAAAGAEMTNQQKITARLGLLMEQTNKVAGDFANTADQSANSFRVLKSRLENVAARLGEKLLPLFDKAVDAVSRLVDWVDSLTDKQQNLLLAFAGTAAALGPALTVLGTAVTTITRLSTALGIAKGALFGPLGLIAGALALGVALGATADAADRAKESITGVGVGGYDEMRKMAQESSKAGKAARARAQALEDAARPMHALYERSKAMEEHWKGIQQQAESTAQAAAETTKEMEIQERLSKAYSSAWEEVNEQWRSISDNLEFQKDVVARIAETGKLTKEQKLDELKAMEEQLTVNAAMLEQADQFPVTDAARLALLEQIHELMEQMEESTEAQTVQLDDLDKILFQLKMTSESTFQAYIADLERTKQLTETINEETKALVSTIVNDLKTGFESTFQAIGEAAESGQDIMNSFGRSVTLVFANLLDSIGKYLLAMAVAYAVALQWGQAALATAGAAAAFASAGFVRSWAEHAFAEGGVIEEPVVGVGLASGESYSFGEKGPERVDALHGSGGEPRPLRIYLDRRLWWSGMYDASENGDIVIHPRGVRIRR